MDKRWSFRPALKSFRPGTNQDWTAGRLGLVLAAVITLSSAASAAPSLTRPEGLVSDLAEKLSPATKQGLEEHLKDFKARTGGIELLVVTIPYESLRGVPIEKYSLQLARHWAIGGKGKGGLLLLIAIKPQDAAGIYHGSTRLEVSRSLAREVPEPIANALISDMQEDFIAGRFDRAVTTGVRNILGHLARELHVALPTDQGIPSASARQTPYQEAHDDYWDDLAVVMGWVLIAAIPFAGVPLVIFLFRTKGLPWRRGEGRIARYSGSSWSPTSNDMQDMPPSDGGPSYDTASVADSAHTSIDSGAPISSSDAASFSGGDFGSSGGGGDFGGGGATGNW